MRRVKDPTILIIQSRSSVKAVSGAFLFSRSTTEQTGSGTNQREREVQEMVAEEVKDIVIHENDIDSCIFDICEREGIDLYKAKQGQWRYVLNRAGERLFKNTDILKDKSIVYNLGSNIPSTNNRYDYEKVNRLCDYYIMISDKYNKLVSIIAFSYLSGIDDTTIDKWKEPSSSGFGIWKKLSERRQDSLKDRLFDSNNPVGAMSIGNTEYLWNLPGVSNRREQRELAPAIPEMERKYLENQGQKQPLPTFPQLEESDN